jgi:hypothetical protein
MWTKGTEEEDFKEEASVLVGYSHTHTHTDTHTHRHMIIIEYLE